MEELHMVGIQGLAGVPEPKSEKPSRLRSDNATRDTSATSSTSSSSQDDVVISDEAKAAAEVSRVSQMASTQETVRSDRIEAARQSVARGDYRKPEVVAKVAERLMKYLG
jgi:anti-sigma28 factor (negative regulator of flagellin synthesis)